MEPDFSSEDHYKVLGVARTASQQEIIKVYKRCALQFHPDKNPDDRTGAQAKFVKIAQAFDVLRDPEKRRRYDQSDPVSAGGRISSSHAERFFQEHFGCTYAEWADRVFREAFGGANPFRAAAPGPEEDRGGGVHYCPRLGALQDGGSANIFAVVWEMSKPGIVERHDGRATNVLVVDTTFDALPCMEWTTTQDTSLFSIQLLKLGLLPFPTIGDVVRCRKVKVQRKSDRYWNMWRREGSSILSFGGGSVPRPGPGQEEADAFDLEALDAGALLDAQLGRERVEEQDYEYARILREWAFEKLSRQSMSKYLSTVADIVSRPTSSPDLIVEVLRVDVESRTFFASDYSCDGEICVRAAMPATTSDWLFAHLRPGMWLKLRGVMGSDLNQDGMPDNYMKVSAAQVSRVPEWCYDVKSRNRHRGSRQVPRPQPAQPPQPAAPAAADRGAPPPAAPAPSAVPSSAALSAPPGAPASAPSVLSAPSAPPGAPASAASVPSAPSAPPGAPAAAAAPLGRLVCDYVAAGASAGAGAGAGVGADDRGGGGFSIREAVEEIRRGRNRNLVVSGFALASATGALRAEPSVEAMLVAACRTCGHRSRWSPASCSKEAKRRRTALPCGHWLHQCLLEGVLHFRDPCPGDDDVELEVQLSESGSELFGYSPTELALNPTARLHAQQLLDAAVANSAAAQHCAALVLPDSHGQPFDVCLLEGTRFV